VKVVKQKKDVCIAIGGKKKEKTIIQTEHKGIERKREKKQISHNAHDGVNNSDVGWR
jgi:hypothetical protein